MGFVAGEFQVLDLLTYTFDLIIFGLNEIFEAEYLFFDWFGFLFFVDVFDEG